MNLSGLMSSRLNINSSLLLQLDSQMPLTAIITDQQFNQSQTSSNNPMIALINESFLQIKP